MGGVGPCWAGFDQRWSKLAKVWPTSDNTRPSSSICCRAWPKFGQSQRINGQNRPMLVETYKCWTNRALTGPSRPKIGPNRPTSAESGQNIHFLKNRSTTWGPASVAKEQLCDHGKTVSRRNSGGAPLPQHNLMWEPEIDIQMVLAGPTPRGPKAPRNLRRNGGRQEGREKMGRRDRGRLRRAHVTTTPRTPA